MPDQPRQHRKLRMAMIGGGRGGFIGDIHRKAAALCGDIDLVAGAFSSDPETSSEVGRSLFLDPERVYGSYQAMLEAEAIRPEDERLDFIVVATPNHLHYESARACIEAGFHVLSDKPVTRTTYEARALKELVCASGRQFGVTFGYLGYPLVTQAREMVARGLLGHLRKVYVEYPQGWLATNLESHGDSQASWRTDPGRSGKSGCIGDIGTHAHSLAEYVTGQEIIEVSAEMTSFVPGRRLDDDGSALFRTSGGARGVLSASQVCVGMENGLKIAVFGTDGGLEWQQQEPNSLVFRRADEPVSIYRAGIDNGYLYDEVRDAFHTPSGHPEGFIEAFSNVYRSFAQNVRHDDDKNGKLVTVPVCPGIDAGLRGMEFIDAMVSSGKDGGKWKRVGEGNEDN